MVHDIKYLPLDFVEDESLPYQEDDYIRMVYDLRDKLNDKLCTTNGFVHISSHRIEGVRRNLLSEFDSA